MDVKGLKEASHIEWRPESFCVPVCDPNDAANTIAVDLMQFMSCNPKYQGRSHKANFIYLCCALNYHN